MQINYISNAPVILFNKFGDIKYDKAHYCRCQQYVHLEVTLSYIIYQTAKLNRLSDGNEKKNLLTLTVQWQVGNKRRVK